MTHTQQVEHVADAYCAHNVTFFGEGSWNATFEMKVAERVISAAKVRLATDLSPKSRLIR